MDLIITGVNEPGEPRFFFGVNADLARWIHKEAENKRSLVRKGLLDKRVTPEQLDDVLALRNPLDRRLVSWEVISALWDSHPELGPYPVADMLETLEDERAFHADYREHALLHQLLVYILGLYLYEHSEVLNKALLEEIEPDLEGRQKRNRAEKEFLRRWLVAATAHDIGYVLETPATDYANPDPHLWGEVKKGLNAIFKRPLSRVPWLSVKEDTEGDLYRLVGFRETEIIGLDALLSSDKLRKFDPLAQDVRLGRSKQIHEGSKQIHELSILERYYDFAQEKGFIRKVCTWIHAILAA